MGSKRFQKLLDIIFYVRNSETQVSTHYKIITSTHVTNSDSFVFCDVSVIGLMNTLKQSTMASGTTMLLFLEVSMTPDSSELMLSSCSVYLHINLG